MLTKLLSDSLGGNSKTVMIANLGPAESNQAETISTLRFAARVKTIKNKPVVVLDPKDAKLKEMSEEIARLKAAIAAQMQREHEMQAAAAAAVDAHLDLDGDGVVSSVSFPGTRMVL